MMKSQTIWEIEDKISALLTEKEKEIIKSTEASGIESTSFRFDPVTEDLKERMAEKSWTTIEVKSIALELRDRPTGSVVHVNDVMEYVCSQCPSMARKIVLRTMVVENSAFSALEHIAFRTMASRETISEWL